MKVKTKSVKVCQLLKHWLATIPTGNLNITQQDLINLIGLKISDEKLTKHFDGLGLKQPKSCTQNNSRGDVANKADNTTYWFRFEVTHEACYPPKREGKPAKWATYLKSISLVNESNILKKPDTKPASFWNLSPPPTADLAAVKAFFGEPTATDENRIYFCKKLNDLFEINCQFSVKQQRAQAIWASVIEQRELISYLYFRELADGASDDHGSGMDAQNFMCMLVKWLHDNKQLRNKHLNTAQTVALPADKPAILAFVHHHFKGKIWQNHLLNQDRVFANFVSDGKTLTDENGTQFRLRFQQIGLKALGKWDEYKNIEIEYDRLKEAGKEPDVFYWIHQEKFLKNIPINESNCALFAKALDENLALYNKLMQLKVNRDYYYVD